MAPRIKLNQQITRARAEEILGEIATLKLERNQQTNEMDRDLTAIRERYETSFEALDKQINEKVALLETWAAANPDEFPKNRKSIEMIHGLIGYRTGTPKLKTLLRWTRAKVLEHLQDNEGNEYIRTKEEVDKDAILSDYAQKILNEERLKKIGVQVVQDETFFVEPKLQEIDNRSTKEAA